MWDFSLSFRRSSADSSHDLTPVDVVVDVDFHIYSNAFSVNNVAVGIPSISVIEGITSISSQAATSWFSSQLFRPSLLHHLHLLPPFELYLDVNLGLHAGPEK
mmetsp:Transcript_8993/g.19282  ORF Transcript_8993/g.19282 Transcript_8993/m.19282 type:complete len:103 (+) Transcript_8993:75-383(+)